MYLNDPYYTAPPSAAVKVTVAAPTVSTTSLFVSAQAFSYGQPITLNATVTGSNVASPASVVTFLDGTTVLGTASVGANGQAQFIATSLPTGANTLTASYSGNITNLGSVSFAVPVTLAQATTQVTAAVQPSAPVYGQSISLAALIGSSVQGEQLGAGSVTFTEGATQLGVSPVKAGAATLTVSAASPGKHTITVSYSGDVNHAPSSTVFTYTVNAAPTSIALPLPAVLKAGKPLILSATVTALPLSKQTPTGQVTFLDGTTVLGKATLINGAATLTLPRGLAVGKHKITAVFGGGTLFVSSQIVDTVSAI